MSQMLRAVLVAVLAVCGWFADPAVSWSAEVPPAASVAAYTYDAHHYADPLSDHAPGRGPPLSPGDSTTHEAVDRWLHGPSVRSGPTTSLTNDPALLLVQIASAATTTEGAAEVTWSGLSSLLPSHVAAKSGVDLGPGVVTRKINWRPNASDPNWGLTSTHLNKHMFGSSKYSLSKIDPGGNADIWRGYMQELASRPHTGTTTNGMLDIIGTFPRTGGSGSFQFGIRLSPTSDGSFDLITLLTKQ